MNKQKRLAIIKNKVMLDVTLRSVRSYASKMILGTGNLDAEIIFIGETPMHEEDVSGLALAGDAGLITKRLLLECNMKIEDVYLTNLIFYATPGGRDPTWPEIRACRPYIRDLIDIVKPKLIIALGRFSAKEFTGYQRIGDCHGQTFDVRIDGKDYKLYTMYHPRAAVKSKRIKKIFEQDFYRLPSILREVKSEKK